MPMAMEDCCIEAVPQDQARSSLPRHSVSILEALKAPKASDLTRKRKVDCNITHHPRKREELAENAQVNRKQLVLVRG